MDDQTPTPEIAPEPPIDLVFDIPSPEAPGFLRRQREAMQHVAALKSRASIKTLDELVTFLLRFVSAPADREQARELLLDLSRADYNALLQAVLYESDVPLASRRQRNAS